MKARSTGSDFAAPPRLERAHEGEPLGHEGLVGFGAFEFVLEGLPDDLGRAELSDRDEAFDQPVDLRVVHGEGHLPCLRT